MSMTDPIADMLTRIRNAQMVGHVDVSMPCSKLKISIAQVLGLLLSGNLAQRLGMQRLFVACAVVLAILAASGWLFLRSRRAPAASPSAA